METPTFSSLAEECEFWKQKCLKLVQEKGNVQKEQEKVKAEYEDYVADSKQLEMEYETIIKQNEKELSKLDSQVKQLRLENDSLHKKLQTSLQELGEKEEETEKLKSEAFTLKKYVTQLEQKNDDLERANRIVTESVSSFETMLNQAYEKNALLESEVDEKEKLQIKLQRLMDEARDLKQELKVREITKPDGENNSPKHSLVFANTEAHSDSQTNSLGFLQNGHHNHNESVTPQDVNRINGNAIASSTRVTAISIIYDLLRRIDRIESKLADWKKISAAASANTTTTSDFCESSSNFDKYIEKQ